MAITASGLYGLTLEKIFIDANSLSLEAESHKALLVTDSYSPLYDTHDFRNDITNEISSVGTNYTTGGNLMTTTEITTASPAAGTLKYDIADMSWSNSTITSAMALIGYFVVGADTSDQLIFLLDFVTAVSTVSGLLTVQIAANGVFNLDYTP